MTATYQLSNSFLSTVNKKETYSFNHFVYSKDKCINYTCSINNVFKNLKCAFIDTMDLNENNIQFCYSEFLF